jgi:hypothetical protein
VELNCLQSPEHQKSNASRASVLFLIVSVCFLLHLLPRPPLSLDEGFFVLGARLLLLLLLLMNIMDMF